MKKTLRIVIFIILGCLMLSGLYQILRWKDTAGNYLSSLDELYNTDDGLIDVAFVGSSHSYSGIYPAVLWEEYGISSFNLSVSGQDRWSAYYQLVELLKTQDPEVVFVDLYALTFERHAVIGNLYRNLLSMKTSLNSIRLVTDYAGEEDWQDLILRWPIIHTRYQELEENDFVSYAINAFGRGALYSWNYEPLNEKEYLSMISGLDAAAEDAPSAEAVLSDQNREWLERMVALSEKESFDLVFTILPYALVDGDREIYNAVIEYAEDAGIDVLDFALLSENGSLAAHAGSAYDLSIDFINNGHLSGYGAVKTTTFLGAYLESWGLPDHRGDPAYAQWTQDDLWFMQTKFRYALDYAADVTDYCAVLAQADSLTAIISLEGDYPGHSSAESAAEPENGETGADSAPVSSSGGTRSEDLYAEGSYYPALSLLGMSEEEYRRGGKWLYQGGELIRILDNDTSAEEYVLDLGPYDTLRVRYTGDLASGNIMIGTTDYSNSSPLQIILYDEIEESIVHARSY